MELTQLKKRKVAIVLPFKTTGGLTGMPPGGVAGFSNLIDEPELRFEGDNSILTSIANQVQIILEPTRIQFLDRSEKVPYRDDFPKRLSQLADFFAKGNGLIYQAIGINIDIEFVISESETVPIALQKKFIREDVLKGTPYTLNGAAIKFWYEVNKTRHLLNIEPKGNSSTSNVFYVHSNATSVLSELPNSDALDKIIKDEFENLTNTLKQLLGS